MAVFDLPAMMDMMRQSELDKQRQAEIQRQIAKEQESDAEFTFEKNGLKVKGKLRDLPRLSQDPALSPYIQGMGQSLAEEQAVDSEERMGRLEEVQSKIADIRNKRFKQELEMAQGDLRTGLFNIQSRAGIVKDLTEQEKRLREMEAELSFNRQTGQMDQMGAMAPVQQQRPVEQVAPVVPAAQPATQAQKVEEVRSFNSAAEARAAGVQPGQTVIIKGQRGTLQPKR
jgi:hypothetical protein